MTKQSAGMVIAVGAVLAVVTATQAATIHVDAANCPGPGNGSEAEPYCSIQTAIDNAVDTDEIVVAPGTYLEAINFLGKAIWLHSSGGAEVTTIDGTGFFHVVQCVSGEGPDTVLDCFTITGGNANGGSYPGNWGGGMHNDGSSPTVTNCTFSGNMADGLGGGMSNFGSSPTVTNCTFSGNSAFTHGGGMSNFLSNLAVTNCTFSGNTANIGGGMYNNLLTRPSVTNCTFSDNDAVIDGGGIYNVSNCLAMASCVLWGDSPNAIGDAGRSTVAHCDVQGGWPGTGNIDADPLFVDPDNGDLRLQAGSPCIDAGDNTAVPLDIMTDLDGNTRFVDDPDTPDSGFGDPPVVDMGAYELQVDDDDDDDDDNDDDDDDDGDDDDDDGDDDDDDD